MKKKLIAMVLAAGAMLGAWADYKAESKNGYTWIYEQEGEESFIVGIAETPSGTLSFPAELGGKPVKNLVGHGWGSFGKYQWQVDEWYGDGGYWQRDWDVAADWPSGVTKVVIPEGVTNIYNGAFKTEDYTDYDGEHHRRGWLNLAVVELPDSLESCDVLDVFGTAPFALSTTFPEFVMSKSGRKLFGLKIYDVRGPWHDMHTIEVPAGVAEIGGRAFSCVCRRADNGWVNISTYNRVFRLVFAGGRPSATARSFASFFEDDDYRFFEDVFYHEGASGWTWGEEWCGVKTYALNEIPEEHTLASNLKFGRIYGGEIWDGNGFTARCIWNNNDIGLYGDEYAFFPVTGTGRITPVILGDVPVGYLDAPQVWTDQKMFDTFTPKGVATSKWKTNDDEPDLWYYETKTGDYEWPKNIWPDKKPVSNRRWIVIHANEKGVWSGVWSVRVGLAGTSEISDPMIVVPSEECEENGLQKLSLGDFFRGITVSGYENFELWDEAKECVEDSFSDADRPSMQTYEFENWRANLSGKAMTFTVTIPSAGTLVVSSEQDDDSPAMKEVFTVKGNNIVSDTETVNPEDWESPDYRYNVTNFWKTSYASYVRRIEVSGKTSLTFTSKSGEEDAEFNRMYFFPKSGKSVAVEVGHIMREDMDGEYSYWGRNYVQGYVTGCGVYKSGETATLNAVSGEGEEFDHWVVRFGNLTLTEAQKTSPTLSFTVTDAMCGEMEDEEQIFISAIWKPKYKITALPSIVGAGTVTGTGRYHEGAVVTLTATAEEGCTFVKWSDGETSPTRQVEVVAADVERVLYACFDAPNGVPMDEGVTFGPFIVGDKVDFDVGLEGYTVKGLPSGLKYDAKKGTVSGAAKAAGEYEVTFSKKGEEDVTVLFSVREEVVSVGCAGLSGGTFTAGVAGSADGIPLEIESETGVKSVAVTKLPAGMKYDTKTGLITGAPTKSGDYNVVVTVTTKSGAKRTETIAISVAALPDTVVGTFNGFVKTEDGEENLGTFQLTTTDAGKLTAKVTTAAGSYSFSGICWDKVEGVVYSATLVTKKGEALTLALDSAAGWNANQLTGSFAAVSSKPPYQVIARKNAFGKMWYFNAEGNERDGWRLSYSENAKAAVLTVTLNADGSTKIAGKLEILNANGKTGTLSVNASGYADVTRLSEGVIIADFAPVVSVKDGKTTLKKALSIRANLWFDRSNDHVEGVGSAKLVEED